MCYSLFFFFKQKTAYEMRISDWSSDVCSSDLFIRSTWAGALSGRRCMTTRPPVERSRFSTFSGSAGGGATGACAGASGSACANEIGRASCRERVCQDVEISVVAVSLKQKTYTVIRLHDTHNITQNKKNQ